MRLLKRWNYWNLMKVQATQKRSFCSFICVMVLYVFFKCNKHQIEQQKNWVREVNNDLIFKQSYTIPSLDILIRHFRLCWQFSHTGCVSGKRVTQITFTLMSIKPNGPASRQSHGWITMHKILYQSMVSVCLLGVEK